MPLRRTLADDGSLPSAKGVRHTRTLTPEEFDLFQQALETPAPPDQALCRLVAQEKQQEPKKTNQ